MVAFDQSRCAFLRENAVNFSTVFPQISAVGVLAVTIRYPVTL